MRITDGYRVWIPQPRFEGADIVRFFACSSHPTFRGPNHFNWIAFVWLFIVSGCSSPRDADTYEVEVTDYKTPTYTNELDLSDDAIADKKPAFDPELVDSRPLGDWEINASAAVVRLDCPLLKPDVPSDLDLLKLKPSYASAIAAAKRTGSFLPSANLFDGAAKQFDDGLYAALDLAAYRGELNNIPSAPTFIAALFEKLPQDSSARPFLGAALELSGRVAKLSEEERKRADEFLEVFAADGAVSTPISFYTWSDELKQVWRFFRFLQREFGDGEIDIPREIAAVLKADETLQKQYEALIGFYAQLTNSMTCLSVNALIGNSDSLTQLATKIGNVRTAVAIFPASTSRETELFNAAFPMGKPAGVNLMARLIKEIQSGKLDLQPRSNEGWYQYQVSALETLLIPSRGQEQQKLLLTGGYKRRLVEAFKALLTKRRETHARQLDVAKNDEAEPIDAGGLQPRLRAEPCATFYLRTARAYAFLENFLLSIVGEEELNELHRLGPGGQNAMPLVAELKRLREQFYGLYLVSCEDIGLKPQFMPDEPVEPSAAKAAALEWIDGVESDPDLLCDTRVSVPIFNDVVNGKTHLWATLGIRLARLDVEYARPPKIRPKDDPSAPWADPKYYQLGSEHYLIPVDEFSEIILAGSRSLTREELRAACDKYDTREAIVEALSAVK